MRNSNSIDIASFILEVVSLQILFRDYNNFDLMQELQTQDEKYLKAIIKNQEEILSILKRKENNHEPVRIKKCFQNIRQPARPRPCQSEGGKRRMACHHGTVRFGEIHTYEYPWLS